MTVWDLYNSFHKFEQAQEKRQRCYEVFDAGSGVCDDQEKKLSEAFARTEEIFNNLIDERIGEFLFDREQEQEQVLYDD